MARERGRVSRAKAVNPLMPGLHIREDGWTAARTRTFLAVLAQTGCVSDAARIAGISRTSVARSRALFAPFDRACFEALAKALRGLEAIAYQRAVEGREMIVYRDGKEVERRVMPSDSLLGLLLKRGDFSEALGRVMTPEEAEKFRLPEAVRHRFIDADEFAAGMVFDEGVKQQRHIATQAESDAVLSRRIALVVKRNLRRELTAGRCGHCQQALNDAARAVIEARFAQPFPPMRGGVPGG